MDLANSDIPGEPHDVDGVAADQRLPAREIHFINRQFHELAQDIFPFFRVKFAKRSLAPAGATDAAEIAVVGQKQFGDERADMERGKKALFQREGTEKFRQLQELPCIHGSRALRKRFADEKIRPSSQMRRSSWRRRNPGLASSAGV